MFKTFKIVVRNILAAPSDQQGSSVFSGVTGETGRAVSAGGLSAREIELRAQLRRNDLIDARRRGWPPEPDVYVDSFGIAVESERRIRRAAREIGWWQKQRLVAAARRGKRPEPTAARQYEFRPG